MSKEEELRQRSSIHLSQKHQKHHKHHMAMPWHDFIPDDDHDLARTASLPAKAAVVGRVGLMMLSCGTGAWRVRDSMNIMARKLGLVCSADIGLISIEFTCIDKDGQSYTQALSLPTTGVNTDKLTRMEHFVKRINRKETKMTLEEIHDELDKIQATPGNYKPYQVGLASALACCAFVFLLGGGIIEMIGSFIGAGLGNYTRRKMLDKHITLLACVAVSVMVACLSYTLSFHASFCLTLRPDTKPAISVQCCSLSRDFRSLRAALTLPKWTCAQVLSDWLTQSSSLGSQRLSAG